MAELFGKYNARQERLLAERQSTDPRYPDAPRIRQVVNTLSSVRITPDTAVTIPAVWACLRYLSQTVAVLPWRVMRDTNVGGQKVPTNPIDWILWKRCSPEWSSFQFRETLTHWALRYGNGYAEIERDGANRPRYLWPIHPDRVKVCRDPDTYSLFYEVDNRLEFRATDMFHIRGFGEGPVGVNVVAYAAESLGWAAAAQLFGAAFFGNGMNVSGIVKVKKELDEPSFQELKKELANLYKGVRNANRTAVLDQDMEWEQVTMDANKAQFISVNQHLVEDICRWFGVPPHKVMHLLRATFSNIEHQAIEVVVDSISPWAHRFEDEADYKLFGEQNRGGFYSKMNLNALMRGDVSARGTYYKMMREVGAFSVNRILQLEDENTISADEGGDKHVMNSAYTTLEMIGEQPPTGTVPADGTPPPARQDNLPPQNAVEEEEVDMDELIAEQDLTDMLDAYEVAHG